MARETRSKGAAPPSSRVYNSTPSLQQAQFPARRKTVRIPRHHNADEDVAPSSSAARALRLKQETLTQLGFVQSSFEEGYEGLDFEDSEGEEEEKGKQEDAAKENRRPKKEEEEESEDDEPPVSSRRRKRRSDTATKGEKRRRTLGDGELNRLKQDDEEEQMDKKSRRRTLGDVPSSRYHTQTLTQFMDREHLVLDSDDEGFDAWLSNSNEEQMIPSSSPNTKAAAQNRQSSIIPQTPTKPIRTEVPSSSQQVTPLSGIMLERYGAPNAMQMSPSSAVANRRVQRAEVNAGPTPVTGTPVRRKLVVEDSYASEGVFTTPSKSMATRTSQEIELGEGIVEIASSTPGGTPTQKRSSVSQGADKGSSVKRVRISSASPLKSSPKKVIIADGRYEIPDSEEEDEDYEEEETVVVVQHETFPAGEETQFVMDHMAVQEPTTETTISSSPPVQRNTSRQQTAAITEQTVLPPPALPALKRLRKPLPPPPASTQFESQRLATSLVQSFPIAAHRTDAILPISPKDLSLITGGYKTSLPLAFRMLSTVVRLWFWDGTEIKYGASLGEAVHQDGNKWEYPLPQVYELNNPLEDAELTLEGICCSKITRCGYIPPSIASGMLWNLARVLFPDENHPENSSDPLGPDDETQGETQQQQQQQEEKTPIKPVEAAPTRTQGSTTSANMSISQQVEAQLQSDIAHSTQFPSDQVLIPSTPEQHESNPRPTRTTTRTPSKPTIRPSQATTVSQCSTPSPTKPSQRPGQSQTIATPLPPPSFTRPSSTQGHHPVPSSSSLHFQDYSAPSPIAPHLLVPLGSSSQLLSKSQMLPDSLLREDDDDE